MDQKLLFLINREWTHPALDLFMAAVSSFNLWTIPMLLAVLAVLVRGGFRARVFLLTLGAIVGINDGLVARSLKRVVDRPRPHQSINDVRQVDLAKARPRLLALAKPVKVKLSRLTLEDVDGRSFPSSHTTNIFSAALVIACFYARFAGIAFAVAALVAYSRIYTGSHWPSDVLTSIFLGLGVSLLLLWLAEWLWRKRGGQWLPAMHAQHPSLLAT